jgi:hypothetical protein
MTGVAGNFWRVYLYKFLGEFYLIVPILIPYYQANGLGRSSVFLIQACCTVAVLTLEIPSGYLADVMGRRRTLVIAAVFFPLGLTVYALGRSLAAFVAAELVLAASIGLRSGCDAALLYDTLVELGRPDDYKKFEGRSFFFTRVGTASASILGGALAVVALRLPFWVNVATGSLMLPVALSFVEPARTKLKAESPWRDILRISRWSLRHRQLRFYILIYALMNSSGILGIWTSFLYFQAVGVGLGWFGVLFALFQLASALSSRRAHVVERALGLRRSLFLLPAVGVFFVLIGLGRSPAFIPFIIINAALWGFSFPILMDGMNRIIPSETRATVLSVGNMAGSLLFAVLGPLFGLLVDAVSVGPAYVVLGGSVLVSAWLVLVYGRKVGAYPQKKDSGGRAPLTSGS